MCERKDLRKELDTEIERILRKYESYRRPAFVLEQDECSAWLSIPNDEDDFFRALLYIGVSEADPYTLDSGYKVHIERAEMNFVKIAYEMIGKYAEVLDTRRYMI